MRRSRDTQPSKPFWDEAHDGFPQSIFYSEKPGTEPFDPDRDKLPWFPPHWLLKLLGRAE